MSKKNSSTSMQPEVQPQSLVLLRGKNTPQEVQANVQKLLEYHGYQLQTGIFKMQLPGGGWVDVPQVQLAPNPPTNQ